MSDSIKEVEKRPATNTGDEIELVELFSRMGRAIARFFKAIATAILYIIAFMFKKWLWLGLSVAAGLLISFLMKSSADELFTSDITFRSNTISNADIISHINKLHTFCSENNMDELARAMNVDKDQVRHIVDIQAYWVIDMGSNGMPDFVDFRNRHSPSDTVNVRMQDRFVVRVQTTVPTELEDIREGLINFVESNSFFADQNELRLRQTASRIARIESDIARLDSLQQVKYFEEPRKLSREGGQIVFLQEQTTQLLHDDILNLYTQRDRQENLLTIHNRLLTTLSDFTPPARPVNTTLYYAKNVVPLLFGLTILVLLLYDNRKKLVTLIRKYQ